MDFHHRLDALEAVWRIWGEVGAGLFDDDWRTETRCPGWDIAAVYAHHSDSPVAMTAQLPAEDTPGTPVTARDVLRGFNVPDGFAHTGAETIAEQAASAKIAPTELVARFQVDGPRAIAALHEARPGLIVPFPGAGAVLPISEALRIVLLEATVHLLDVLRALGQKPDLPEAALADCARLLADVAPPVEFIEAATGRAEWSPVLR